jgi:hypothetical protein
MPVISMLHDIIRTNFLDDLHHGVPHTHACPSEFEASMRIDDDDVLTGELSRKGNAEQLPFTARQQPSAAGGLRSRSAATAATPRCVIVAWQEHRAGADAVCLVEPVDGAPAVIAGDGIRASVGQGNRSKRPEWGARTRSLHPIAAQKPEIAGSECVVHTLHKDAVVSTPSRKYLTKKLRAVVDA